MFEGREPIYVQIAEQVRAEVLSGVLGEEEQVMSTTQYATTYRINPATAAKAFAELVDEGVLYKRRGVGMFVAAGARGRLLAEHRARFFTEVLDPVLAQAAVLGITADQLARHIRGSAADSSAADSSTTDSATEPEGDAR
ncbi:GntR family transcriptional regulator [Cellulomonas fimi]|uniref:GntR family transcriptional regulator n=1 Tax=Cellulomonas fimi TaxID=1708 RepID=A0A7Y0LZ04_CELFI|nr:GntR family transcriptional regulator [Cellulomonas fimi]NMR20479.1 GntR family transcriptional regulator [Cellulomonas fimi]